MSLAKALVLSNCGTEEDLRVPWTARWSNQSILKEINPEYSLEGLILKLKLPILCHLMGKADSLEKTLMLGKTEGRRRGEYRGWDGWMASPIWWTWVWASSQSCWWIGKPGREGNGNPIRYSCLENPMDGGAWWAAVHGVVKSWTRLSDFTFTFHFHALEKEMAAHSSVLAKRIPGTGEPGGLPSVGSYRVGHDWSDSEAAAAVAV